MFLLDITLSILIRESGVGSRCKYLIKLKIKKYKLLLKDFDEAVQVQKNKREKNYLIKMISD